MLPPTTSASPKYAQEVRPTRFELRLNAARRFTVLHLPLLESTDWAISPSSLTLIGLRVLRIPGIWVFVAVTQRA